jgi:FkbM family methyltransferase
MLISLQYLIEIYDLQIEGIVHIGASYGQEIDDYEKAGIKNIIWVEADPDVYNSLCENLRSYPDSKCFLACVSNRDGEPIQFKISSNKGQSSSILKLKEHAKLYPHVVVVREVQLKSVTFDTLLQQEGIEISGNYNFLNMDIQGAELLAMQGMKNNLHKFKYIYLEVNRRELYEGCALEKDIDKFLRRYHFKSVESKMKRQGWGDKFYIQE